MNKRTRGIRRPSAALVLTERDRCLLSCTGVMRYMSASQIARAFFPSEDRCRKRLRQLYDAKLLAVTLAGSTTPNIVSLTPDGVRVVAETDPELAERLRLPGTLRAAGLAHHLGLVDVRLYLSALTKGGGPELLRWTNAETLRESAFELPKLVPDGLAELAVGDGRLVLAVEFDAGSEVLTTVRKKFERYVEAHRDDQVDEVWFVVDDRGGARVGNIAAVARDAGAGEFTRVMPLSHVTARPVRQPLARVGDRAWAEGPNTVHGSSHNSTHNQADARIGPAGDRRPDRRAVR